METTLVVIGLLAVAGVAVVLWGGLRWRKILRIGGVTVAVRWRTDREDRGWHLGIGRYRGEEFLWFRVFSLRSGPDRVLSRSDLLIVERREPTSGELYALPVGASVLRLKRGKDGPLEISMATDTLTGFLSWLESSPPGHSIRRAS